MRLTVDDSEDWFLLQTPKRSNNGKQITNVVQCPHNSTLLKTKNLYLTYDDETGIGTIQHLVNRALQNTGWTLGLCDTFYEADGFTEKVRSLKSEGKVGTYQLITNICNLFQAYPTYHGDTKTVDIHGIQNKLPIQEMWVGKNLQTLAVDNSSSNLITRLYVEGDYGEFGYVGIDDVNPTGLSYILNFDYYRQIGVFTAAHETAYNTYMTDMPATVAAIKTKSSQIATLEDTLNTAWGQSNYVLYTLSGGQITKTIVGGNVKDENKVVRANDHFAVFKATGNYREVAASAQGVVTWANDDVYAIKFLPSVNSTVGSLQVNSGQIAAKQVAIEAKQKLITSLQHDYDIETDPLKKAAIADQISGLQADIQTIYNGNADTTGLYSAMRTAVNNAVTLDTRLGELSTLQTQQLTIEATFSAAIGDMLRDGYWADNNYAPGQEESLYADSLVMMEQLSKPQVNISVSLGYLADEMGYHEDTPQINTKIHLIDDNLEVDDVAYIAKRTLYLSDPRKDSVDIATSEVALSGKSFDSVIGRISQLADLLNQRSTLYDRSRAINGNGSIYMERLAGMMNVMKNKITSTVSNWYTDDNGAQIFESVDGSAAMMLTGEGFMIADGKTSDGEWNWRTFGTGKGFTADAIVTGYLSADRLEAGTISGDKIVAGGITVTQLANNSVTADKIVSGAVTAVKIEDGAVIANKIATGAVETNKLAAGAVTTAKLDAGAVTADKITSGAVTTDKLDALAVTAAKIASNAITTDKLAANAVTAAKIDVADLFAAQATITQLNAYDIRGNQYLRLAVNRIYPQWADPALTASNNVQDGDIWQKTTGIYKWSDFGTLKWSDLSGYTWDSFGEGIQYVRRNGAWEMINDPNSKYSIVSGIEIFEPGVEISGRKYVRIRSGGSFLVDSGNFSIDENGNVTMAGTVKASSGQIGGWTIGSDKLSSGNGTSYVQMAVSGDYAFLAGNETESSAPFRVKRDGTVYLKQLLTVNEQGAETTVDLQNYPFWKLYYHTIKSYTASSITLSNGAVINFNTAAQLIMEASWSSSGGTDIFTVNVKDSTDQVIMSTSENFTSGKGVGNSSHGRMFTIDTFDSNHKAYGYVNASPYHPDGRLVTFNVDASGEYNSGYDAGELSVTVTDIGQTTPASYANQSYTVHARASASNGRYRDKDLTVDASAAFKDGNNTAYANQTVVGTCYIITAHSGDWVKVQEVGTGYSRVPYMN